MLLGVDDTYTAWCLDNAVAEFGRALDSELKSIEGKTSKELMSKTQRVLGRWLDVEVKYRDPAKAGVVQMPSSD